MHTVHATDTPPAFHPPAHESARAVAPDNPFSKFLDSEAVAPALSQQTSSLPAGSLPAGSLPVDSLPIGTLAAGPAANLQIAETRLGPGPNDLSHRHPLPNGLGGDPNAFESATPPTLLTAGRSQGSPELTISAFEERDELDPSGLDSNDRDSSGILPFCVAFLPVPATAPITPVVSKTPQDSSQQQRLDSSPASASANAIPPSPPSAFSILASTPASNVSGSPLRPVSNAANPPSLSRLDSTAVSSQAASPAARSGAESDANSSPDTDAESAPSALRLRFAKSLAVVARSSSSPDIRGFSPSSAESSLAPPPVEEDAMASRVGRNPKDPISVPHSGPGAESASSSQPSSEFLVVGAQSPSSAPSSTATGAESATNSAAEPAGVPSGPVPNVSSDTGDSPSVPLPQQSRLGLAATETILEKNASQSMRVVSIRLPIEDGTGSGGSIDIAVARRSQNLEVSLSGSSAGLQRAVSESLESLVRKLAVDQWTSLGSGSSDQRQFPAADRAGAMNLPLEVPSPALERGAGAEFRINPDLAPEAASRLTASKTDFSRADDSSPGQDPSRDQSSAGESQSRQQQQEENRRQRQMRSETWNRTATSAFELQSLLNAATS